jgi:hypothetical protein
LREIRGKQGGLGKNAIFFLPLESEQRGGWRGHGRPAGAPAGGPAHGRGWGVGKSERGTRGSHPRAHLGLGRAVEAAPREDSGAAAVLGGDGAVGLGEEGRSCCETAVVRCGDPGKPSSLFIGGGWRFGGEIFPGELHSGELEELREAATGDATARAAASQLVQGVLGARGRWRSGRWCRPEVTARAGGLMAAGRVLVAGWHRRPGQAWARGGVRRRVGLPAC